MAVLLSATKKPAKTPPCHENPIARNAIQTKDTVRTICSNPPQITKRPTAAICSSESSRPIVNMSKTMPISARVSTACTLRIQRSPSGPKITPAMRNPMMAGKRNF